MGCAQMQVEDAGIRQTAGLLRNGALTFTGQALRIYARSHLVLLAQNSRSAYVSAVSPAGKFGLRERARMRRCGKLAHPQREGGEDGGFSLRAHVLPPLSPPWKLH